MSTQKRGSDKAGRGPLGSLGRPPVAQREHMQRFWEAIEDYALTEDHRAIRLRTADCLITVEAG